MCNYVSVAVKLDESEEYGADDAKPRELAIMHGHVLLCYWMASCQLVCVEQEVLSKLRAAWTFSLAGGVC